MLFKLISDSGYEREINSVAVASQQVEVFSKVFKTTITKLIEEGIQHEEKNMKEIIVSLRCLLFYVWVFKMQIFFAQKHF